jgi:hypothetical protein
MVSPVTPPRFSFLPHILRIISCIFQRILVSDYLGLALHSFWGFTSLGCLECNATSRSLTYIVDTNNKVHTVKGCAYQALHFDVCFRAIDSLIYPEVFPCYKICA